MKRLLQALLILIVLVVAAYWLLIDGLVENLIETEGSKALRAKFEVESADFQLLPTALTLRGVAATDPTAPQQNLFTADEITLELDAGAALDRQLIADQATLHGLRFNQPRTDSGAIPGLTPPPTATPAATTVQDAQRQQLRGELDNIQRDLTALLDRWRQRLQALPDAATVQRWLARGATAEINAARQQMRDLQAEFNRDHARLRQQLAAAQAVPQQAPGRAAPLQITQALVGARFAPLLRQLTERLSAPPADVQAGQWPVLARKTTLDGQFEAGGNALRFTGTIDNATPQPGHWRLPIAFTLASAAGQPGSFSASGALDYRSAPNHSARLAFEALPVRGLEVGDERLSATLASAIATGQGRLALQGGQLELELHGRFEQARFNITASDDPVAQAAAQVLGSTRAFELRLQASGPEQQPRIALSSSLDQPLAAAVGQALQQPGATADLRARIQRELGPELAGIQQLTAEFNALQEQLRQKQAALRAAGPW